MVEEVTGAARCNACGCREWTVYTLLRRENGVVAQAACRGCGAVRKRATGSDALDAVRQLRSALGES